MKAKRAIKLAERLVAHYVKRYGRSANLVIAVGTTTYKAIAEIQGCAEKCWGDTPMANGVKIVPDRRVPESMVMMGDLVRVAAVIQKIGPPDNFFDRIALQGAGA